MCLLHAHLTFQPTLKDDVSLHPIHFSFMQQPYGSKSETHVFKYLFNDLLFYFECTSLKTKY